MDFGYFVLQFTRKAWYNWSPWKYWIERQVLRSRNKYKVCCLRHWWVLCYEVGERTKAVYLQVRNWIIKKAGRNAPSYLCMSRPLPRDIDLLEKLPQKTITLGMKSFSIQLSNILCRFLSVSGTSKWTSERKKKWVSCNSSRTLTARCA